MLLLEFVVYGLGLLLFAAVVILGAGAWARSVKHKRPKGCVDFQPFEGDVSGRRKDCTVDSFKIAKIPKDLDYVIVGSGMGSLYTAALLAKVGKRVLVLEQHYVAGGCTHAFEDKGFEFDTGLHYVGRIEKYKILLDLVSSPGKEVEWAKMGSAADGWCYDEIKLGTKGKIHHLRAGAPAFVEDLVAKFPLERAAIEEYVRLCKRCNKTADMYFYAKLFHPAVQWLVNRLLNKEYFSFARATTAEIIGGLTSNAELAALLCGQFGDYGLKPEDGSFVIHAGIVAHYLDGAYYPIGGSQQISRALIPTIERAGGRVLVKARVETILVDAAGRAVGVRVKNGKSSVDVRAKNVISGVGAHLTDTLVPAAHRARLGYAPMLKKVKQSISHVYAFVGLKGTTESLGLRPANLWVLPVDDKFKFSGAAMDQSDVVLPADKKSNPWKDVGDKQEEDEMLLFMGCPSAKDPSWAKRFPGKSTVCIISTAHHQWFDRFFDAPSGKWDRVNMSGKRGKKFPEYLELKKSLEHKMRLSIYRHYPKTKGHIEYIEIATPLTNMYYLGRPDSYGLEHTPAHYAGALDHLRPQTTLPGLLVTGQDVASVGIVGALNSGILTAHAALGYGAWDLVVAKRNLIEDLMAFDKASKKKMA